jgi:hypothetical protein
MNAVRASSEETYAGALTTSEAIDLSDAIELSVKVTGYQLLICERFTSAGFGGHMNDVRLPRHIYGVVLRDESENESSGDDIGRDEE